MTKALRRWAGRTGAAQNSDSLGNGGVLGGTAPVFGMDQGETYLRWSQAAGVFGYMADILTPTNYWQTTFDIRVPVVPPASILFYQPRTTASVAQGSIVLTRINATNYGIFTRSSGDLQLTPNTALPAGGWYRMQLALQNNTASASPYNGRAMARLTRLSDGVVIGQGEQTGLNTGTAAQPYTRHHLGKLSSANQLDIDVKNLVVANDAYEYLDAPEFVVVDGVKRIITSKSVIVNGAKVAPTGYYRIVDGNKIPIT